MPSRRSKRRRGAENRQREQGHPLRLRAVELRVRRTPARSTRGGCTALHSAVSAASCSISPGQPHARPQQQASVNHNSDRTPLLIFQQLDDVVRRRLIVERQSTTSNKDADRRSFVAERHLLPRRPAEDEIADYALALGTAARQVTALRITTSTARIAASATTTTAAQPRRRRATLGSWMRVERGKNGATGAPGRQDEACPRATAAPARSGARSTSGCSRGTGRGRGGVPAGTRRRPRPGALVGAGVAAQVS